MRGAPVCDVCEERAYDDLQAIARCWPGTEAMLTAPNKGGDGTGVRSTKNPGIDLNEKTVAARVDITNTLTFWVHLLIEEHPTLTAPRGEADTLARFIGTNLRHLTRHHDHGLAVSIIEDARRLSKLCKRIAYPTGARRYEPGIPCVEHDTNDLGERIPCPGEYGAWVWDGMNHRPDLTCNADPTHVIEPSGFKRLARRVTPEQAMVNLMQKIAG